MNPTENFLQNVNEKVKDNIIRKLVETKEPTEIKELRNVTKLAIKVFMLICTGENNGTKPS